MARGLDKEVKNSTPPRRNPFRQEIISIEEPRRHEKDANKEETEHNNKTQEIKKRQEEYKKVTEELRLLLKRRIDLDRSFLGDKHQRINDLGKRIRQKSEERDGLSKILRDLRSE